MSWCAVKRAGLVFVLLFSAGILTQVAARAALTAIGSEPPSNAAVDMATALLFACGAVAWTVVSSRRKRQVPWPFLTFFLLWALYSAFKLMAPALTGGS